MPYRAASGFTSVVELAATLALQSGTSKFENRREIFIDVLLMRLPTGWVGLEEELRTMK